MGFIRGALVIFISILLLVSLLLMNLSLTFALSLKYENVKETTGPDIIEDINEKVNLEHEISQRLNEINDVCVENANYNFTEQNYNFTFDCSVIDLGEEAIINESLENIVKEKYYQEYDCKFWKCIKEEKSLHFIFSEKSRAQWHGNFVKLLFLSLIFVVILFFLVEKKHNAFLIPGSLLILASLPFVKIGLLASFSTNSSILNYFKILFSMASDVFAISIISGIVLVTIGVIIKLFLMGFKISNWFNKKSKINDSPSPPPETIKKPVVKEIKKSKAKK